MRELGRWLRRATSSVRVRVALATASIFAVVLVAASMWLLHAVETRLTQRTRDDTESAVQSQAQRAFAAGRVGPGGVEVVGTASASGDVAGNIRYVTADGVTIVAFERGAASASTGVPSTDVLVSSVSGAWQAAQTLDAQTAAQLGVVDGGGPYLVATVPVTDQWSLAAVSSLAGVYDTIDSMRAVLWWIVPALVLLVGALAWLVVGRALRPVHAVTRQVASIGSDSLHERVPVPASADEVGELAATMNSMLDRLESATRVNRQLVSDASHELRTPIAVLRAEIEVAQRDRATDWQAVSAGMLTEVERLQGLVDDLLLLARAAERGMARGPVDVVDVVAQAAARRRVVPVEIDVEPVPAVQGDDVALLRAVDHLVANAARHATAAVRVRVRDDAGVSVVVSVDDDGAGIPPADRERVLDRFVRLDDGRARDAGGSGLGLAVVSDVAVAHGGTVAIDESSLGGARVTLTLPVEPPHSYLAPISFRKPTKLAGASGAQAPGS